MQDVAKIAISVDDAKKCILVEYRYTILDCYSKMSNEAILKLERVLLLAYAELDEAQAAYQLFESTEYQRIANTASRAMCYLTLTPARQQRSIVLRTAAQHFNALED